MPTEKKHGQYIITEMKDNLQMPAFRPQGKLDPKRAVQMLWLDNDVLSGGFYVECVWIWPRPDEETPRSVAVPHTHEHDEVLGFFGTDPGAFTIWAGK